MVFSTLNRPKSCHVLRNVSDDEEEDTKDESNFEHTCKSSVLNSGDTNAANVQLNNHNLNNVFPSRLSQATPQDALNNDSKISDHIDDKKNDIDSRIAIRENTFVTNEPSLTTLSSTCNPEFSEKYQLVNPQTQMLVVNFPPITFDLQLSRYRRLNFDQIKTDLTISRRGAFIVQALRWVSR